MLDGVPDPECVPDCVSEGESVPDGLGDPLRVPDVLGDPDPVREDVPLRDCDGVVEHLNLRPVSAMPAQPFGSTAHVAPPSGEATGSTGSAKPAVGTPPALLYTS